MGSLLIGIIGLITSATVLPFWALLIIVIYLIIVLVTILTRPVKNYISKIINRYNKLHFAKKMQPELLNLSRVLNELLESQRINSIPYFITNLPSKLSPEVQTSTCLYKDGEQFKILQSWAWSLSDNFKYDNLTMFLRDTNQFSILVNWFTWACVWVRQVLDKTEISEKIYKDVVSDWNASVQKISNFTSRVERLTKSINSKYNTDICTTSFQDIKPL